MTMITYSKDQADPVGMIAAYLANNFLKSLFDFYNEKNYYGYIESLTEILGWSHEFYSQYYHKLNDWEAFEGSKDNIFNAINEDDFLLAWGYERINQFFAQNANERGYSDCKTGKKTETFCS